MMKKYTKDELFNAFKHYADCDSIRIDHEENEYTERTMSDIMFVTLVEKLFYEDKMGVMPEPKSATDEQIGKLVEKIAYSQLAEEQSDDFIEKIWLVREFLNAL